MADQFDPAEYQKVKDQFDPEEFAKVKQGGLGESGDFDFKGSAKRTGKRIWNNYIEKQVIPAATSFAATRLPAMTIGGPAGLIAAPLVEGLYQFGAGFAGEKLNQLAGLTPSNDLEAAGQGAAQGLIAAGGKFGSMMRPFTGRKGAVLANDLASTEGRRMIQKYAPTKSADVAFDEAFKEGATIPMTATASVMERVMAPIGGERTLSYAYGPAARDIRVIQSELASGKPLSAKQWQFLHTRLGQTIGTMESAGQKKGLDRAKQLYAAMYDDLERVAENEVTPQNTGIIQDAVTPLGKQPITLRPRPIRQPGETVPKLGTDNLPVVPERGQVPSTDLKPGKEYTLNQDITATPKAPGTGAGKLKTALETYRREKTVEDIQKYVEGATKTLRGQGGDTQFNAAEVIRKLKQDKFYTKAFTAEERKDIEQTLEVLNTIPVLPSARGVNSGSKRMFERGAEAVAGGTGGLFLGGLPGMAAGAIAGFGVRDVRDFAENVTFALSTKVGRELIKELSKTKGGIMTPRNMSVLTSYVSALRHEPDSEMAMPVAKPYGSGQLQPGPNP